MAAPSIAWSQGIAVPGGHAQSGTYLVQLLSLPTIAAGDILLFWIATDGDNAFTAGSPPQIYIDHPHYFGVVAEASNGSASFGGMAYRYCDGTEGGASRDLYIYTDSDEPAYIVAMLIAGNPTHEFPIIAGPTATGTSNAPNPGSVPGPLGTRDVLYLACAAWDHTDTWVANPTVYTTVQNGNSGTASGDCGGAVSYRQMTSQTDAHDAPAYSISGSEDWVTCNFAILGDKSPIVCENYAVDAPEGTTVVGNTGQRQYVAVSFTPRESCSIEEVDFYGAKVGSPSSSLRVSLRTAYNGSDAVYDDVTNITSTGWYAATFSSPYAVTAGTQYWVVFSTSTVSSSNYYNIAYLFSSNPSETFRYYNDGAWTEDSNTDVVLQLRKSIPTKTTTFETFLKKTIGITHDVQSVTTSPTTKSHSVGVLTINKLLTANEDWVYHFEGGTDGAQILTTDTTSGNHFDIVGTSTQATYSTAMSVTGTKSGKLSYPDTGCALAWTGINAANYYVRFYFTSSATPSYNFNFFGDGYWTNEGTLDASPRLQWLTTNKLALLGSSGTYTYTPGVWYRCEFHQWLEGGFAKHEIKTYLGHGTEVIETASGNYSDYDYSVVLWYTKPSANPGYIDDINLNNYEWKGPSQKTSSSSVDTYTIIRPELSSSVDTYTEVGSQTYTTSHDALSLLTKTQEKTYEVESLHSATFQTIHDLTSLIMKRGILTHSVESLSVKTQSIAASVESLFSKSFTTTSDVGGLLKKESSTTHNIQTFTLTKNQTSSSVLSLLLNTAKEAYEVDTYLAVETQTVTKTHDVEALISKSASLTSDVNGLILGTQTVWSLVESLTKKSQTFPHDVQALLKATSAAESEVDTLLSKSSTTSHVLEANILKAQVSAHDVDTYTELSAQTVTKTHDVVALLQQQKTSTHDVDAATVTYVTRQHEVEGLLRKETYFASSVDALILQPQTTWSLIDSLTKKEQTSSHDLDTLTKSTSTAESAVNVLLQTLEAVVHSAEAIIVKTALQTQDVVVWTAARTTIAHNVETLTQATATISHSVDAEIVSIVTKISDVEALLQKTLETSSEVETQTKIVPTIVQSVDALALATSTATSEVEAILHKTVETSHDVDTMTVTGKVSTHLVDVFLQKEQTLAHEVQSYSIYKQQSASDVDVLLVQTSTPASSVDAIVYQTVVLLPISDVSNQGWHDEFGETSDIYDSINDGVNE